MNWKNVNLTDAYQVNQNIIDPLTFDTLLLEINCNIKDISMASIEAQFLTDLNSKIDSAKEVFYNNQKNILKEALKYKNLK